MTFTEEMVSAISGIEREGFATILDALPAAVCIYDEDDKILFWNERYYQLFPWHRDSMFVGRRYEDALRVFFESNLGEEERPNLERHLAIGVKRHKDLKEPFVFQTQSSVWVKVSPVRLPTGHYIKVWSELTPEMVSQNDYRDVMDTITAIHIGFCFFDKAGRFMLNNVRLAEMIPASVHLFSPGRSFGDFLSGCAEMSLTQESREAVQPLIDRAFPVTETFSPLQLMTLDGAYLEYEESKTAEGGVIAVWTDITTRVKDEQRLRESEAQARAAHDEIQALNDDLEARIRQRTSELSRALERAQQSDEAKSRLMANVSHELRTPLNAILGFSQVMAGGVSISLTTEKYQEYSKDIQDSAEYLLSLIDSLLKMTALEARKSPESKAPIDIEGLFDHCETMLLTQAAKLGVDLIFNLDGGPKTVFATRTALLQVMLNLSTNALRYTPPGGQVHFTATSLPDGGVELSIRDTGTGMPPEKLASLGSAFSDDQWVRSDPKRGSGIGIPLSILLMETMGGSLTFESTPGEGTTARLSLPGMNTD